MSPEVTAFIDNLTQAWQVEICSGLRQMIRQSIPDVQERIQYGKPHFLKNGKYAAVITPSKDAVSFTIFHAAGLQLPNDLFDGPPERKTIKIRNGTAPDYDMLANLLVQASSSL